MVMHCSDGRPTSTKWGKKAGNPTGSQKGEKAVIKVALRGLEKAYQGLTGTLTHSICCCAGGFDSPCSRMWAYSLLESS